MFAVRKKLKQAGEQLAMKLTSHVATAKKGSWPGSPHKHMHESSFIKKISYRIFGSEQPLYGPHELITYTLSQPIIAILWVSTRTYRIQKQFSHLLLSTLFITVERRCIHACT